MLLRTHNAVLLMLLQAHNVVLLMLLRAHNAVLLMLLRAHNAGASAECCAFNIFLLIYRKR